MSNSLKNIEDVDDDLFISKKPQSYIFADKKAQDLVEKTNKSMLNSRILVEEAEKAGQHTLESLSIQRETLEKAENNLDSINTMTRYTQKQLKGMRGWLGGFRSIFGGNSNQPVPTLPSSSNPGGMTKSATMSQLPSSSSNYASGPSARSDRSNVASSSRDVESIQARATNHQEAVPQDDFEANLSEVGFGISKLKEMALRLGDEIGDQNEMLDRITEKSERAGDSIKHQNRQVQQLLKKG